MRMKVVSVIIGVLGKFKNSERVQSRSKSMEEYRQYKPFFMSCHYRTQVIMSLHSYLFCIICELTSWERWGYGFPLLFLRFSNQSFSCPKLAANQDQKSQSTLLINPQAGWDKKENDPRLRILILSVFWASQWNSLPVDFC